MGREVRRVPANWEHPKRENGRLIPLYDGKGFHAKVAEWDRESQAWKDQDLGKLPDYVTQKHFTEYPSYEDYAGKRPLEEDYMPAWPEEMRTHFQMYEDTTEGTPISPVFETPEELARWLADNGASAMGRETATYDEWFAMIKQGWAPCAAIRNGEMKSGVADALKD